MDDKEATARAMPRVGVVEGQDVIIWDKEVTGAADVAWDPKNTFPKVIDGDPNTAQVLVAPLIPVKEGMPDLKDTSLEEPLEEEPQANNPSMEVHPAMLWVCFKAQVCQDEVQYLVAMFTWFHNIHYSWEERKKDDT